MSRSYEGWKRPGNVRSLAVSILPSLALCTKKVATVKESRCIGDSLEGHCDRDG